MASPAAPDHEDPHPLTATSAPDPATPGLGLRLSLGLIVGIATVPLGSTMVAIALPDIGRDLDASPEVLTHGLVTSYLAVSIVCQGPSGKLGDLFGHLRLFRLGHVVSALAAVLGTVGRDVVTLTVARCLAAVGGALLVPSAFALVRLTAPPERRGRSFGTLGAAMSLAAASGPIVGSLLARSIGWPALFAVNLPMVALSALLVRAPTAPTASRRAPRLDLVGTLLLVLALGTGVVAVKLGAAHVATLPLAIVGVLGLAVFIFWERRVAEPVLDVRLFLRPPFAIAATVVALHNLAMYTALFQMPVFFTAVRGLRADQVGPALLAMMLAMVVASPLGGRLSDRIGARVLVTSGSLIAAAGLGWLWRLDTVWLPMDAVPALLLAGFGLGIANAGVQTTAMAATEAHESGMASGAMATFRYVGGVIGMAVLASTLKLDPSGLDAHRSVLALCTSALVLGGLLFALPAALPRARASGSDPRA